MLFNPQKAKNYDGTEPLVVTQDNDTICKWKVNPDFTIEFIMEDGKAYVTRICNMEVMTVDGFIPELRFNNILQSWFCVSPNDVIRHKLTTDESEAEYITKMYGTDTTTYESAGVCKSVIDAIAHWNRLVVDLIWASSYTLIMDPYECVT